MAAKDIFPEYLLTQIGHTKHHISLVKPPHSHPEACHQEVEDVKIETLGGSALSAKFEAENITVGYAQPYNIMCVCSMGCRTTVGREERGLVYVADKFMSRLSCQPLLRTSILSSMSSPVMPAT